MNEIVRIQMKVVNLNWNNNFHDFQLKNRSRWNSVFFSSIIHEHFTGLSFWIGTGFSLLWELSYVGLLLDFKQRQICKNLLAETGRFCHNVPNESESLSSSFLHKAILPKFTEPEGSEEKYFCAQNSLCNTPELSLFLRWFLLLFYLSFQ